jgi:hypothetical protein
MTAPEITLGFSRATPRVTSSPRARTPRRCPSTPLQDSRGEPERSHRSRSIVRHDVLRSALIELEAGVGDSVNDAVRACERLAILQRMARQWNECVLEEDSRRDLFDRLVPQLQYRQRGVESRNHDGDELLRASEGRVACSPDRTVARDVPTLPDIPVRGQPVLRIPAAMPLIVNSSGRSALASPERARRRRSICM